MGAASEGGIGVDWEVGTIVWVRRRNGSWWPGRILGQHELSASHLMSPRSGTPVKLLGREDASVDWYNLEKSKRVKAFRCGEFDACIEKAEAARGIPIKKREKYARREDAIIHALELERQMLEGKLSKLGGSMPTNYSGTIKKEPAVDFQSESHIMADDTFAPGKLTKCRKVGLAVATKGKSLSAVAGIGDTLFTNQDGTSDVAPRMKVLQDFGLQAVSKRKIAALGSCENFRRSFHLDNIDDSHLGSMRDMDGSYNYGNKKSFSPSKNRRLLGGFTEESKRRDRRRPLLQVLQSSAKLQSPPSMACNGYATDHMKVWSSQFGYNSYLEEENAFSGLIEPYEPMLPEKLHLDPDMEQEETLLSSTSQSFAHELTDSGRDAGYGRRMDHVLEQDGCPNRNVGLVRGRTFDCKGDAGVSRWNLKGKRNIRKLSKKAENLESERNVYNDQRGRSIQQGLYSQTGDSDDSDFIEREMQSEFDLIDDEVRYQPTFQGSPMDYTDDSLDGSDKDSEGISLSGWDNEKLHHAPRRRQWDEDPQQFGYVYAGQFHDRMESRLVDVNLKVQASYQGERVPLVSLMSRLNGKAIIGHPLQIEIVSDGFTGTLLSDNDSGGNPSQSYGTTMQPVWPTGRRSSMPRIPRPHTASSMEGEAGIHHYANSDSRAACKRSLPVNCGDQTSLVKKVSHSHRSAKKSHKKSSKKMSLPNLKTRTLSSLAKGQKHATSQNKGGKLSNKTSSLSILMKPGETVPTVACVPVKVVFSRILEAVGRTPSNAMAHRHLLTAAGSNDGKSS